MGYISRLGTKAKRIRLHPGSRGSRVRGMLVGSKSECQPQFGIREVWIYTGLRYISSLGQEVRYNCWCAHSGTRQRLRSCLSPCYATCAA
jgi:hypothetical protein